MASRTVYARPVVVSEERLTEVMITKAKQRAQKEALDRQVREARGLGQDLSRRSRSPGHSTSHLSKYSALGDNPSSPFLSPQGSPTLRPVGASGGVSRAAATRYTLHYGNDGQCLFTSDNEKPVESRPSGVRRLEEPTSSTLMRSHSHEEFHGAPPSAYNTNSLPVELIRRMERGDFSGAPRSSASPVRDHEGGAPSGGLRHHGMEDRRWADAAEPTRSPTARFPSRGAARDTTPRKNVGGRLPPLELPTDTSPSTMVEVNLDRSVDSGVSKVERLQRELEARQDAMRKMRQKEKGWERQVEQLKVELRHARQTERSTAAQARSPARGPPRRAETAPDPPPKALDGGGPMHPTGVRRPDPRRPQRPKESKPDFTKAQRFNAGNFRPITAPDPPESSTLDSFRQWHAGYPEEEPLPKPKGPSPMEGNLQLASKSAQKTALGLSEEAADLPVLIEYEHIFQFAEAQIITAQQAEGLWKFLMGRRTVSSAPAPNTLDDMPAQAKSQRVEASPRRDGTPERRPQRQDYDQGASPRPVFAAGLRKKIERIHGKSRPKVERQDDLTSEDADCSITSSSSRGLGSFSSEVMDALEEEEHRLVEAEPVRRHLS